MIKMEGFRLWYARIFMIFWIGGIGYILYLAVMDFSFITIPMIFIGAIFFGVFVYASRFIYFGKPLFVINEERIQINSPFKKIVEYADITKILYNDTFFQRNHIWIYTESASPARISLPAKKAKETYTDLMKYSNRVLDIEESKDNTQLNNVLNNFSKGDKTVLILTGILWISTFVVANLTGFLPNLKFLYIIVILPLVPLHLYTMIILFKLFIKTYRDNQNM